MNDKILKIIWMFESYGVQGVEIYLSRVCVQLQEWWAGFISLNFKLSKQFVCPPSTEMQGYKSLENNSILPHAGSKPDKWIILWSNFILSWLQKEFKCLAAHWTESKESETNPTWQIPENFRALECPLQINRWDLQPL